MAPLTIRLIKNQASVEKQIQNLKKVNKNRLDQVKNGTFESKF